MVAPRAHHSTGQPSVESNFHIDSNVPLYDIAMDCSLTRSCNASTTALPHARSCDDSSSLARSAELCGVVVLRYSSTSSRSITNRSPTSVHIKECNFDLYRPVRAIHTGPPGYRYADRPIRAIRTGPPGYGTARYRAVSPKSTVGGRLREKSTVDGRLREKKKEEEKKKERRRGEEERSTSLPHTVLARMPSLPARRHRPRPRAIFLPREEKDRGDSSTANPTRLPKRSRDRSRTAIHKEVQEVEDLLRRPSKFWATAEMSPKRTERAWKMRSCHKVELFTSSHQSEAVRWARTTDDESIGRRPRQG
ncbi:hypothetical protein BHM03_00049160 [Ensete ventricosum]|nr:hypothetical protein BHM03_00049160 [Ensete ventricosum]